MILKYGLTFTALATAIIATPILAQQRDRPSRECRQEVVQLCGRDRSEIRACLTEKFAQLSDKCSAELQQRMQQRGQREGANRGVRGASQASIAPDATIFYGEHDRQQLDYFTAKAETDTPPPLVLFVHGGGWAFGDHKMSVQQKPAHFTAAGYAFASTGYRLVPDASVEEQARDIASAVAALRGQAEELGFDPNRIVLMGHSAGAHLAALVSSDPHYAGDDLAAIKGVVLLDGAGYDIASSMATANPRAKRLYSNAFGSDPERHGALSPITHVGAPDAPDWLILFVAERGRSGEQSQMLAGELSTAGANAEAVAIQNTDHGRMNREMGTAAGRQQTRAVDAFLAELSG
ncbi:MAG: alpha/beta hydrolase [Pseudomonadota bacterium]